MDYKQQEFFALIEEVEAQGGGHLDKQCKAKTYKFGNNHKPLTLPSCGNSALFVVPYEALNKDGSEAGMHPLEVCAVDDDMGRWPRFGGDRFAAPEHFIQLED